MGWLAVDRNGDEWEYMYEEPIFIKKDENEGYWIAKSKKDVVNILPKGTIEKLTGINLKHKDKPIKI